MRKQADRQKRELLAKVERLKRRNKVGKRDLINLGLVEDENTAFNDIFGSPTSSAAVDPGKKIQIQDDESGNPLNKSFERAQINPQGQGSITSRTQRQGFNTTNLSPVQQEQDELFGDGDLVASQHDLPQGDRLTLQNFNMSQQDQ